MKRLTLLALKAQDLPLSSWQAAETTLLAEKGDLEKQLQDSDAALKKVRQIIASLSGKAAPAGGEKDKRSRISDEGKKRLATAQTWRWARDAFAADPSPENKKAMEAAKTAYEEAHGKPAPEKGAKKKK